MSTRMQFGPVIVEAEQGQAVVSCDVEPRVRVAMTVVELRCLAGTLHQVADDLEDEQRGAADKQWKSGLVGTFAALMQQAMQNAAPPHEPELSPED